MDLAGKAIVVTGAAHGIGRALCRRFHAAGARAILVADTDADAAAGLACELGLLFAQCDVSVESEVAQLVATAENAFGGLDLFCSNAGVAAEGGIEASDAEWERIWRVNFLAHLYAARAAIPGMLVRGGGYLLQTVSAAGLLTQIGSAPYSVSKHAALALGEWLAIAYGDAGIKVSCLCPQGVRTAMLDAARGPAAELLRSQSVTPEAVADAVVEGLAEERFLILPHPEVLDYFRRKANDYDRWLRGMRRMQARLKAALP